MVFFQEILWPVLLYTSATKPPNIGTARKNLHQNQQHIEPNFYQLGRTYFEKIRCIKIITMYPSNRLRVQAGSCAQRKTQYRCACPCAACKDQRG
mmetsp:Transcript_36125/g.40332  ORF Transcript_36125/g.40332 Transcript_36125/m.40332 type:complete len:95 (-) Transcript_36125:788-1072(-)